MGRAAGARAPPRGDAAGRPRRLGASLAAAILLACPGGSAEAGFDCADGYSDRAETWSEEKRDWCCFHKSIACRGGAGLAGANASRGARGAAAANASEAGSGRNSSRRGRPRAAGERAHDCEAGYARWREDWPEAKKRWCCLEENRGCPWSDFFDCGEGSAEDQAAWTAAKRGWCCRHAGLACAGAGGPPGGARGAEGQEDPQPSDGAAEERSPRGLPTTPVPPFDCSAGYWQWEAGWSSMKKAWCCQNQNKGCGSTTTITEVSSTPGTTQSTWTESSSRRPTTLEPFDCWDERPGSWSRARLQWCCAHAGEGCEALAPPTTTGAAAAGATESAAWEAYDCWEGDLDWRDSWTPKQVDWCCQHSGFGCMEAGEPATCVARRAGDEAGWSSQRRSWCCTHEAIGCPRTTDTSTPTPSSTGLRSTLTTSRETTTTLNLALTSTTSEGPAEEDASCFEANVAYEPLDMLGATVTVERSAEDCQARCRRSTGCESFSFWKPGRHCHLQDASARRQGLMLQFVAGRPLCGDRARPSAPEARQAMRCFEQASYWPAMGGPVSLAAEGGSSMDLRDVAKLCQQLCHDTSGCAHFFVQRGPRRMCHLAGAGAHRVAAVGAIAGPRSCAELGLGLGLQGKARRGAPRFAAAPGANAAELAVASLAAVAACAGVCLAATARRAASRWRTHEYTALDLDLDLDAAAEGDPIL